MLFPFLPKFLKNFIVPFIVIGSMPRAKFEYFRERPCPVAANGRYNAERPFAISSNFAVDSLRTKMIERSGMCQTRSIPPLSRPSAPMVRLVPKLMK